jgi:hypothetical protein
MHVIFRDWLFVRSARLFNILHLSCLQVVAYENLSSYRSQCNAATNIHSAELAMRTYRNRHTVEVGMGILLIDLQLP